MMRDKHIDVMLFWGIIFVVMGHNYQLPWLFFPAYAFHMGLFFFISGYLFSIKETFKDKMLYVGKKIKKQLLPYLIINIFIGALTFWLSKSEIMIGGKFTLKNLFVKPFIDGHQYYLIVPLWFLLNLFLVNVIAQIINLKNTRKAKIIVFLIILPIALYLVYKGLNNYKDFRLPIVRTGFALLFFEIGILIKEFKDILIKIIKNPISIFIMWATVAILRNVFGKIEYAIVWGSVQNKFFIIPLITTLLIIFISYVICYYLAQIIKDDSWIIKIGQKTFYIMAFHLLIFFIVNFILYKLNFISIKQLSTYNFSYNAPQLFLFYQIPAIVLPVMLGILIDKKVPTIKNWIIEKFKNIIKQVI